ncbi:MAG: 5'-nucleotidase C-terminal domain-containing protein [Fimbriimonadaceae bacterium]|nr:MAG: 5'-nucleotidase C-terminal domain-containing protein [Fimbriimonadaceae bacterium]
MTRRILTLGAALALASVSLADFKLTILHTNDLHAHVEPTRTRQYDLGGYARHATLIRDLREGATNPILLNAGDTFQGTLFFNVYQGLADLAYMNYVGYQAMAVGNHEFDRGPVPLGDFARLAKFPLLAANLDVSAEPALAGVVKPSTVLEVGGERVGIVGCVTADLESVSSPGPNVKVLPLVESVQQEIDALTGQGVNKVVVLSHCGYEEEKEMGRQLHGVDVIVGGHSHSLLGRFDQDYLRPRGPYPTVFKNADGDTTLLVQAWEWGKVVGRIEVTFDDAGKVQSWTDAGPELVTPLIAEDPVLASMVSALTKPIESLMKQVVGSADVALDRGSANGESLMGNVIADAMLAATAKQGSVAAFMNAGGVRAALEAGEVTYGQAITVQPFNNTLVVLDLTGAELRAALEHGGSKLPEFGGGFLYPSRGVKMVFDPAKPSGQRMATLTIDGSPVEDGQVYRITFNSFTAAGGDGHEGLRDAKGERSDTGLLDIDALIEYFKSNSPVIARREGRVVVKG